MWVNGLPADTGGNVSWGSLFSYRSAGLVIESEIVLPGLFGLDPSSCAPDLRIRRGAVPDSLPDCATRGLTWQMSRTELLLHVPGVVSFLVTDGREIAFRPVGGADDNDVATFLIGTALGVVLHQRRRLVLHGSAVVVDGKAVLFCGRSGAGKSTIAAALTQRGHEFLADDVCAIQMAPDGRAMVLPEGRSLRLWREAIDNLALQRGNRLRRTLEKYFVQEPATLSESMPIGAIYALREARPPFAAGIDQPNIVEAAVILRRVTYKPLLAEQVKRASDHFAATVQVANAAPVFQLTRPLDFGVLPNVIARLSQHWVDVGLVAA